MTFNYVFMPVVICAAGIFIVWLSSRRILALSRKRFQAWRKIIERGVLSIVIPLVLAIVGSRPFGTLPVLIISHDPAKLLPAKPSAADLERQNTWNQMQNDMKNLSTRSRRIIAKNSSPHVMVDRADLIKKEVPVFIEQIRGAASQPTTYGSTETE